MKDGYVCDMYALLDNLEVGIVVLHGKGIENLIPVFGNKEYFKLSGLTQDQFKLFMTKKNNYGIHPDDMEGVRTAFFEAYHSHQTVHYTLRILSSNQEYCWVSIRGDFKYKKDNDFDVFVVFENAEQNVHELQILTERYHYLIEESSQSASETLSTIHFNLTTNTCRSIFHAICLCENSSHFGRKY